MGAIDDRHRAQVRRITIGAAIVIALVAIASAVLFGATAPKAAVDVVAPSATATQQPTAIFVHVLGAVEQPGLYQLRSGDRGIDAIAAAGGFARKADQSALNLARFVDDGEQIIVPVAGSDGATASAQTGAVPGKVNLNSADAVTLETLPRVGPAMSARIIAWRDENGRFASVDDLKNVSGIGEKTFAELKDLVTT